MTSRLFPGLLAGFCLLSATAQAERSAALPRRARLLLPVCPELPFEQEEFISTLRVELLDHGTELQPSESEQDLYDMVLIVVDSPSCEAADIALRIQYPSTERTVSRALDLEQHASGERGRIMALAAAELLRDAWPELSAIAEVAPEPRETPPPAPVIRQVVDTEQDRRLAIAAAVAEIERRQAAAEPDVHRVMLTVSLLGRSYPIVQGGTIGGRLGVSILLSRNAPLRLEIDGAYAHGGGTAEIGDIVVDSALGGLALHVQSSSGRARGSIGARLELGYSWAEGRPSDPTVSPASTSSFVLSAALTGGVRILLGGRFWLTFDALVGWVPVALEPHAEGRSLGGIGRLLIGADLGIAIGL